MSTILPKLLHISFSLNLFCNFININKRHHRIYSLTTVQIGMCKFACEIFEYSLEDSFKVIRYTKAIGDLAYDAVFVFLRVDHFVGCLYCVLALH